MSNVRGPFKLGQVYHSIGKVGEMRGGDLHDWSMRAYTLLNAETERWVRQALEKGKGWNVWRSHPRASADGFTITHDFMLIEPDGNVPGDGVLFIQPDLTDGERARLLAGRYDWQEHRWEDECGVPDCGHSCCERARR